MTQKIEIFNTGGGITLAEAELDGGRYAVVSTEAPDCIAVYNKVDDEPYMPEDMIGCYTVGEMSEELKELHKAGLNVIKKWNAERRQRQKVEEDDHAND